MLFLIRMQVPWGRDLASFDRSTENLAQSQPSIHICKTTWWGLLGGMDCGLVTLDSLPSNTVESRTPLLGFMVKRGLHSFK